MERELWNDLQDVLLTVMPHSSTFYRFQDRLRLGNLTREDDPVSHVGTFFVPYDPVTRRVFLIHHKKSGLWIPPGGHVDKGERLMETVLREMREELGVGCPPDTEPRPFFLSVTPVHSPGYACREHYDVWYCFPTDGKDFVPDMHEFHDHRWVTVDQGLKLSGDALRQEGLLRLARYLDWRKK